MTQTGTTPAPDETIGLIGLGIMGGLLARRLIDAGTPLVLHNRTAARCEAFRGQAEIAPTPAGVARRARTILTVLTGPDALEEVLFGTDGIAGAAASGTLLLDLGTQSPHRLTGIAARAAEAGIAIVEAPMTGSVHDASHGTLGFLVGGAPADVARVRPVLERLGRAVFVFGPLGSGNTAKLALNLLVGTMAKALGESMTLLERSGLSPGLFLDALDASGLASPLYRRVGTRRLEQSFAPRFALKDLRKDIRFLMECLDHHRQPAALARALADVLDGLEPDSLALDYSALVALEPSSPVPEHT